MTLRSDLRTRIRNEMQDTSGSPLWSDVAINNDLADAFADYSQYFPQRLNIGFTSTANQTAFPLTGVLVLAVQAVIVDGVTVVGVPDEATLYEPSFRNQVSQTVVQPVTPFGAAATHGQAWAFFGGAVNFRYALSAGRLVTIYYTAAHVCPSDDVTAITPPDSDLELFVLYVCDRLVRSAHTDAIKRGAPGAWADAQEDSGYLNRYTALLVQRRRNVRTRTITVLQ